MKTTKYYAEITYIVNAANNCPKTLKTELNTSKVDTIRAAEKMIADIPTYENLVININKEEVETRQIFIRFVNDNKYTLKSAQGSVHRLRTYLDEKHVLFTCTCNITANFADVIFSDASENLTHQIFSWISQGNVNNIGKVEID